MLSAYDDMEPKEAMVAVAGWGGGGGGWTRKTKQAKCIAQPSSPWRDPSIESKREGKGGFEKEHMCSKIVESKTHIQVAGQLLQLEMAQPCSAHLTLLESSRVCSRLALELRTRLRVLMWGSCGLHFYKSSCCAIQTFRGYFQRRMKQKKKFLEVTRSSPQEGTVTESNSPS